MKIPEDWADQITRRVMAVSLRNTVLMFFGLSIMNLWLSRDEPRSEAVLGIVYALVFAPVCALVSSFIFSMIGFLWRWRSSDEDQ